jgi:hypothetical protein
MIAEVGFAGKIRHARRIGLINKPMANCLMVLAQIRNSFAHLPIKDTLTNDDDEELREAVAKLAFARDFEINHGDSRSGMETRRSIVMVFMALFFQHNDLKLRVRPNANGPGSEVAVTDNSRSDGLPPSPRGRL